MRRQLWRWLGWFALSNAVVFLLMSLPFLHTNAAPDTGITWIYLVTVFIGNHVLLAGLPLFCLVGPLVLVWPRARFVMPAAVFLVAVLIALLQLDSLLWSQSRFHLNILTVRILGYQSWIFVAVLFLIGLWFESYLAGITWRWLQSAPSRRGILVGSFCGFCVLLSQGIHAWADASYYVSVTAVSNQVPLYGGITAKSLLSRSGLVDPAASRERELAKRLSREVGHSSNSALNYPLEPLQCSDPSGLNLLIIMIDAMRSDMLNASTAPNIHAFAKTQGTLFSEHFSGGNSSRMGVFSLFYSLPPGYWSSFESLHRPPVLVDHLQSSGYQLGIFSSQTMYRPVMLDRTAFASIPNLRLSSEPLSDPSWKRDQTLNADWFEWLSKRDPDRPFFGFLFYDAVTTRSFPEDYAEQFRPEGDAERDELLAGYETAVHFDDGLVAEVLEDLAQRELSDSTVVIITSDHGEEFDDSGMGLKKHGSGFTRYQLQTPMVVAWPGRPRGEVRSYRSSHYDVVPTLMQDLFGCRNEARTYGVGHNLFDQQPWDWIIAGSYFNFAVLQPDRITVTYPNGGSEVRNWSYQLVQEPRFDGELLEAVAEQNTRFYSP